MSATYQKFHERLKEERLRLQLSQLEISQLLRMSQSHYSKAELGKRRLSYYEMQVYAKRKQMYFTFLQAKNVRKSCKMLFWHILMRKLSAIWEYYVQY